MDQITKALDLIKASGWQNAMLSLGAWIYIGLSKNDYVPALEGGWFAVAHVFAFVTAALALAAVGSQASRLGGFALKVWQNWYLRRAVQRRFRSHIGYFDQHDRKILGYLLHHRLKMFDVAMDGGHASKLIAQGFVVRIAARNQIVDQNNMPVAIPDYIWSILEERAADFPHQPEFDGVGRGRIETHPWRVHWMAR